MFANFVVSVVALFTRLCSRLLVVRVPHEEIGSGFSVGAYKIVFSGLFCFLLNKWLKNNLASSLSG